MVVMGTVGHGGASGGGGSHGKASSSSSTSSKSHDLSLILSRLESAVDAPQASTRLRLAKEANLLLADIDEQATTLLLATNTADRHGNGHSAGVVDLRANTLLMRGRALALMEQAKQDAPSSSSSSHANHANHANAKQGREHEETTAHNNSNGNGRARLSPLNVHDLAASSADPWPETATACLLAATRLTPEKPATWLHLGFALWREGDINGASHCFARAAAVRNTPKDAKGEDDDEEEEDNADMANALRNLAFVRRTQADNAQRSAEAAAEGGRDDGERTTAKLLRDARRCVAEAIWLAKKAVKLEPRGHSGWAGLATSYLRASLLPTTSISAGAKEAEVPPPPPHAESLTLALRAYAQADAVMRDDADLPDFVRAEILFNRSVARTMAEDFAGARADAEAAGALDPTLPCEQKCENLATSCTALHAAVSLGKHTVPTAKVARLAAAAATGTVPIDATAAACIAELEAGARGTLVVAVACHLEVPTGAPSTLLCFDAAGAAIAISLPFAGTAVGPGKVRAGSVLSLPTARVMQHKYGAPGDGAPHLFWRAVRVADPTDPAHLLLDGKPLPTA